MSESTISRQSEEYLGRVYLVVLALASLAAAFSRIPPQALFSAAPPALQSYAKYIYFIDLHARFLGEGAFWGYDPTFGAGILTGAGWMVPYLFQSVIAWLTGLSGASVVKLTLFFHFLLAPLWIYAGGRLFGLKRLAAALAGVLVLCVEHFTLRTNYVMTGLVNSAVAHSLILPAAGLIYRINLERSRWLLTLAVVTLAGIVIGSINPTALGSTAIAFAALWIWQRERLLNLRGLAVLFGGGLLAAAALWPWAASGWAFARALSDVYDFFYGLNRLEWVWAHSGWVYLVYAQPLLLVVLFAGGAQVKRWRDSGNRLGLYLGGVFGLTVLWVGAIILAGLAANLYPVRFIDAAVDFLALPAGVFLARALITEKKPGLPAAALHVAFWCALFYPLALYLLMMVLSAIKIGLWIRDRKVVGFVAAALYLFIGLLVAVILGDPGGDSMRFAMGPYFGSAVLGIPALLLWYPVFFPNGLRARRSLIWALFFLATGLHIAAYFMGLYIYDQKLWEAKMSLATDRPALMELAETLRDQTSPDARILVENTHNPDTQALGFDIAGLMPSLVPGREFIALPNSETSGVIYSTFLKEGALAWIPLRGYDADDLAQYMDTYNIGWVVTTTSASQVAFDRHPQLFAPLATIDDGLKVFLVRRDRSFFLAGSGTVHAEPNRLVLRELAPNDEGVVLLSYRWYGSLCTEEGIPLERRLNDFDPGGLIVLRNPPRQVTVVNCAAHGFPDMKQDFNRYRQVVARKLNALGIATNQPAGTGYVEKSDTP
ncbi:MAG: hypothetical protein P9L99_01775 [Candidatus Lernaella stagnicola]|nr:hypothetical protein [Candidatus Lernaella stagnicola]